ncbi:MAG: phytase [Pseudomonadota bacterium]|uniref:phytase n=1 Tax=Gallaecimonas pentaromativorans TaxID=584787 RepID=UPI00067F60BA|nr:phytase [Gallaecimonas pentaromativorans]MED5526056.1 phytase [Pseudomonadota bacterium]
MKALLTLTLLAQGALASQLPYQGSELDISQQGLSWQGKTLVKGAVDPLNLSQDGALLMAVDKADQQLRLWQGAKEVFSAPVTDRVVEAVCSYQSPRDGSLHLFILDDRGSGEEWLVKTSHWLKAPKRLRTLNIPYKSTACATDSASESLFISEDDQALWRYSAELEAEPKRQLLDAAAPFGALSGETKALAVRPDGLLVRLGTHSLDLYPNATRPKAPEQGTQRLTLRKPGAELLAVNGDNANLGGTVLALPKLAVSHYQAPVIAEVQAIAQTLPADRIGDAMDDPAIWVNHQHPEQSRVLGTDKRGALEVYDLNGKRLQRLAVGRVNNVDVRQGFLLGGKTVDIATASHRDHNAISVFAIAPDSGEVSLLGEVPTPLKDIYGLCMYQPQGQMQVFVNDKNGRVLQYRLDDNQGAIKGTLVRDFRVNTQPEGCVADDKRGRFFLGEEDVGIWAFNADDTQAPAGTLIAKVGPMLHADVEGLALWQGQRPILVASSQGNDSYVAYSALPPYQLLGRFRIGLNSEAGIDGTSETDGIDITSLALGKAYPQGLLAVQDGRKRLPEQGQNFKLVPFDAVLKLLQQ